MIVEVADIEAAHAYFFDQGLTDGLPVVPPTRRLVDAMLDASPRPADDVVGVVAGRAAAITVEQVAVSAVMAGSLPSYLPVILATWEAVFDPALNASATLGSSGGSAITAVVSGPYAREIGMSSEHELVGPGSRANATIGRAVRLGIRNALGYRSGALDASAFGTQARFTAHFAEREPPSGWAPLRVRLGYPEAATTVTVAMTDAPRQVSHNRSGDAANVLRALGTCMRDLSHVAAARPSAYFLVLGPEHTTVLENASWTPDTIAEHLSIATRTSVDELEAAGVPYTADRFSPDADGLLATAHPEDLFVITAGGAGAGWSHVVFGYAPTFVFRPVTKVVRTP